jgi:hypothetical protein
MVARHSRDIRLQQIRIASPCPESWDAMRGDDRVRHCDRCDLNVYNFAHWTAEEVGVLLDRAGERLCGRLFRRQDGSILLRDCPVGFAAIRRNLRRTAAAVAMLFISVIAGITSALPGRQINLRERPTIAESLRRFSPIAAIARWSALSQDPPSAPPVVGDVIMGEMDTTVGVVLIDELEAR